MNVKKRIKYIITTLFAFVVAIIISGQGFLSAFLQPKHVYANTTESKSYEETSVSEDLESLNIDITKTYDDVNLLYFLEYGYGYDSLYSIYLYTYIPLNSAFISPIDFTSRRNAISFGYSNNAEDVLRVEYLKYNISTKQITENNEDVNWMVYNNSNTGIFVKWKVDLSNFILPKNENRYFCVSGIELHENRNALATEFLVGNVFHCYNDGTNNCVDRQPLETVDVDVYHTFYRTGVSLNDKTLESGWQNQLSSCYFSLPKFIGNVNTSNLSSITAIFNYRYTTPILILGGDDSASLIYSAFSNGIFGNVSYFDKLYFYSTFSKHAHRESDGPGYVNIVDYYFRDLYNWESFIFWRDVVGDFKDTILQNIPPKNEIIKNCNAEFLFNSIGWLFYDKNLKNYIKDGKVTEDYFFDGNNLYNYYELYKFDKFSAYLFDSDSVAESCNLLGLKSNKTTMLTYGNEGVNNVDITKLTFSNLLQNQTGISFWEELGNSLEVWWESLFGYRASYNEEVGPLEKVNYNDVYSLTNEEFSNKYFVDINEVSSLKAFCREQEILDKQVWLFRYDICEYYSNTVSCFYEVGNEDNRETYTTTGFMAREPVYLDFDILQFGFNQDGKEFIIPAIHSPENVFNDLTAQQDVDTTEIFDFLKVILMLILGVALIIILWPFISPVIIALFKLIFKGLGLIFKLLFNVIIFPFKLIFGKKKQKKR